ncbi:hypothetical protein GHT06_009924 [Daphnia sinensis]|uniref:Uncharacterized protein n=1 Tax=Daphnia sinensis TaxID=1820382 RepID=A0AAD5PX24_9CRUS|nr:hypothetical protein GHT06_009924 [Daphnia sinensis]
MRTNEDTGLETTFERRSVRKGPLIQRFVRSVRERFSPLRSGGESPSILRNNENQSVELVNDSPHQSDIDLLDSDEIRELRNNDQWNEVLNMQVESQENETVVEPLIGDETRELLSYNQLLEQARMITNVENTADGVENTRETSTDFQNPELIQEDNQDREWFYHQYGNTRITEIPVDDLIFELQYLLLGTALRALLLTEPTILTPIQLFKHCGLKSFYENTDSEYESETPRKNTPTKTIRAEIHKQVEQVPLDNVITTPTISYPGENYSQSRLQSRKVSFTPTSTVNQSKTVQNKPLEPKDMSVKIYVKELSRLMESGMDYEDASKAADCIAQRYLTNNSEIERIRDIEQQLDFVYNTTNQKYCNSSEHSYKQVIGMEKVILRLHNLTDTDAHPTAHSQYARDRTTDGINGVAREIRALQCENRLLAHKTAIATAQHSGWLAASYLNLPICSKLIATGESISVYQCSPTNSTITTEITSCGPQPKLGDYTLDTEGWELTPYNPCYWHKNYVNINGRAYFYKNSSWHPIVPGVIIQGHSLINTLPYEIDKLLALSLHPALTPHPMSTSAAIAEIIAAAKEEHSIDLGNPFHLSTLLSTLHTQKRRKCFPIV